MIFIWILKKKRSKKRNTGIDLQQIIIENMKHIFNNNSLKINAYLYSIEIMETFQVPTIPTL
jgi:hypothetical protein